MKKYKNTAAYINAYYTDVLEETLTDYGNAGYRLVSAQVMEEKNCVQIMYLFFTKEVEE